MNHCVFTGYGYMNDEKHVYFAGAAYIQMQSVVELRQAYNLFLYNFLR